MTFKHLIAFLAITSLFQSCDFIIQEKGNEHNLISENHDDQKRKNGGSETSVKVIDLPSRQNFSDRDLVYMGNSIALTRHGRCRMDCRNIDAYEVQEVINKGSINKRKSDPNSKPCPTIAFEGKTSDGQTARVVLGTCEGNYKIVTVIDLDTDWKCKCK